MKSVINNVVKNTLILFTSIFCIASPAFAVLDATLVSDNIPTEMHPGETRRLSVTMQNTGDEPWTGLIGDENDFRLASQNIPGDVWLYQVFLLDPTETINPGEQKTFTFYLKAPDTGGTYDSLWQMKQESTGTFFGEVVTDSILVDESVVPEWDSLIISDTLPTELYPGEPRLVEIVIENTGAGDWSGDRYALSSRQNTPEDLWDTILYLELGAAETIAPTEQKTFTFVITAPSPPTYPEGTYDCNWQMLNIGPDNVHFGELLSEPVTVNSSVIPQLGNTLTGNTIPTDMFPGEARSATITFENTGTITWDETNVRLYAPTATWGTNRIYTLGSGETVAQGGSKTFTVIIIAPGTEGTYDCDWTMQGAWNIEGSNQFKQFGDYVSEPVNVDNGVTALLNAEVVSHTIPAAMSSGQVLSVDVTMRNTGSATWDGSDPNWIRLRTQNSPTGLWTTFNIDLDPADSIAPGQTKTFTFDITAPLTPDAYQCRWQLQKHWPNPNTFLGELLDVPVQVGAIPEICDDGLDNDGDSDIDCADSDCNGELCDDGDACTTGETCSGAVCGGGSSVVCDDGNVCTDDVCTAGVGCEYTNNTDPCDDGLYCNGLDTCNNGTCSVHEGNPCTPQVCDENLNECAGTGDFDEDGVSDISDNCPQTPNGPLLGTCIYGIVEGACMANEECGLNGFCSMNQEDNYPPPDGNSLGDACECEGDFDCDGDVDGSDANLFKRDFGRSFFKNPCPNCP